MESLRMSAQVLQVLILAADAWLILYKIKVGRAFSWSEFLSYLVLSLFLIYVVHKLDTI